MKLTHFIQTYMDQLLKQWEAAVIEIAPELKDKDNYVLRDHAKEMLEFVVREIVQYQTPEELANKALGHGKPPICDVGNEHGKERHIQGLTIHQMVQELRALRARVICAWSDKQGGLDKKNINELIRFNEAIDHLIETSMSSFLILREQEIHLIETMLQASLDPVAILKPNGKFLFLNNIMEDLINAESGDFIGRTPSEVGLKFAEELQDDIAATASTGQPQRREHPCTLASGRELFFDCQLVPIFDDHNKVEAIVFNARDITDRKQVEYQEWRNANFDFLTGLPNRRLFIDRLEQTILEAERKASTFALLFIDLDRFKQANDLLGHLAGDQLLVQVANRIGNYVRAMDTFARLGGDEFTLIMKDTNSKGALEVANALLVNLEQPFEVGTDQVQLSGSFGLTFFPDDGSNVEKLLLNADLAMYFAKERGGQQVQVYKPSMTKKETEHKRLSRELRNALNDNQLEVYYQPIIEIRTGAISGAEALLRWNHPDKGLLSPSAFLNSTYINGMADEIDAFVLKEAMICQRQWSKLSGQIFPIHVNESPTSFVTHSLIKKWLAKMTNIGLDKNCIIRNLTPASFKNLQDSGLLPANKADVNDSSLSMAIDNFGIEQFSLSSLKSSNLEIIKIDRELVKNAGMGGETDQVLKAIISMAHAINFKVMGIGVETDEQLQFLSDADCDYAQGYHFSKPISCENFEALLSSEDLHGSPFNTIH